MEAIRGAMFGEMPVELRETIFNPEEIRESADNEKEGDEKAAKLREKLAVSTDDYLEIARMLWREMSMSTSLPNVRWVSRR
jgi:DNA-directed RNA polymerase sigma subunit (sigma70/sigma32)